MSGDIQRKVAMLDTAQSAALQSALKNRVALIQGPPGTGKTFIGVLLCQILLSSTNEKILIVTYTNHALDDVLEDLLDVGITGIVRLGGRSRSDRLKEYNLREQASSGKAPFTREQTRRYAQLRETIEEAEKDVDRLQRSLSQEIGEKWWNSTVGPFLEQYYPEHWEQLRVKPASMESNDGFRVHGISGPDHLWKCWLKGRAPPRFLDVDGNLWRLNKDERRHQKLEWQHEIYEGERAEMATALATIQTSREELRQLREMTDAMILAEARVIGCTTTKAAMCKNLLDGLSPGIVLVEEAAEIMEPHVLTSLSIRTKRLIMIGDHKQLRPKCQHYPLTVEAGRGFDLNRSLFERLASVIPISSLEAQYRMHPDISAIPRLTTYPNLKDAPSVSSRPRPMGIASRIVFVDHDIEEDREADTDESLDTVSRTNTLEAVMVVQTVRYLFQQGYHPTDLAVLTPYLGQMMKIQNMLSKSYDVFVDDRDIVEAREQLGNFELPTGKQGATGDAKSLVRIATIDNYQGEEAKVVLVSLVRSNPRGHIGFLREAERVNVMLSRARECEIIFGSRNTFEKARGSYKPLRGGPLWKTILESLESSGFIYPGLPVKCQEHETLSLVTSPADFSNLCPDGGCYEICGKELDCGHACTKHCHVGSCAQCDVICQDTCPRGHVLMRACGYDPPRCKQVITWRCPLDHRVSGPCCRGRFQVQCKSCTKIKQEADARAARESDLQADFDHKYDKLEDLNQRLEDALRAKEKKEELARIEKEIALVKQALGEVLQTEVIAEPPQMKEVPHALTDVGQKARAMLEGVHPKPLDLLLNSYKRKFGTDLRDDAQQTNATALEPKKGTRRSKLEDVLAEIPCCEIVHVPTAPSGGKGTKMLVRLRTKSETTCVSTAQEERSQKRQKVLLSNRASSNGPSCQANDLDVIGSEGISKPAGIGALSAILQRELDPNGVFPPVPSLKVSDHSGLVNTLCALANADYLSREYPHQARLQAKAGLEHSKKLDGDLPAEWIGRLERLASLSSLRRSDEKASSVPATTALKNEWDDILAKNHDAPSVMKDAILPMIGLQEVKRKFINMYHRLKVAKDQGNSTAASYNARFEGNPGTGKTTIARHYGTYLSQAGVLDEDSIFRETSGAKLIHDGVKALKEILEEVKEAGVGVIFVDEAYQLTFDREGKKLWTLSFH